MSPDNFTLARLIALGPIIVGLIFIWTGAIKAVAPHTFRDHLTSLGRFSSTFVRIAVTSVAALEVMAGVSLVVGLAPSVVHPFTVVLLICLSAVSWWGVSSGKATDCGCYGGFVQPSIYQSLGVNALFIAMILVAWKLKPTGALTTDWRLVVALSSGIIAGVTADYAQRYQGRTGDLLFDTNPLKLGGRFKHAWAGGVTAKITGEYVVSFLGPDCPFCAQWVRVGNALSQSPTLPPVIGVLASAQDKRDRFIRENAVRFPIGTISQSLMGRLAQAVPTTVLVDEGRIRKMWVGSAPPAEFVDRMKTAFFPHATANSHLT